MKKMKFSLSPETGTLTEQDAKRYISTVGFATCVLMVAYFACSYAIGFLIGRFAPFIWENAWLTQIVSLIPLYGIAVPLFYIILNRLPRDEIDSIGMGAGGFWGGFCVVWAVTMLGSYVSSFLILIVENWSGRTLTNPVAELTEGNTWWINLIFVAIVAPILEELVFRKLLCRRLLPLGEGYAIVLSSAIFGLAHGNLFQFLYAFAGGVIFALIYVKTGRIRYSVIYHMIINTLGSVFAPWILKRLQPLMDHPELLEEMQSLSQTDPVAALEMMEPYLFPLLAMLAYEGLMMICAILGLVFLIRGRGKIRLSAGLLPPPKKGRVANVFCNVGTAAALTVFAAIFVLSLWS